MLHYGPKNHCFYYFQSPRWQKYVTLYIKNVIISSLETEHCRYQPIEKNNRKYEHQSNSRLRERYILGAA